VAAVAQGDADGLLQERLRAHIEFLAADELRGRQPGTEGYDIAARYVASHFAQFGLLPAGAQGSYLQPVPLRRATQEPDSARMSLVRDGQRRDFRFVDEFYMGAQTAHAASALEAEMVFAGYGIHAPELGYSDFKQLDVQGKIVVTLAGQPLDFPSEEGAHFGSSREKARAIAAHGGIGWVTVYTPRSQKRYAWDRVRNRVGMPSMAWLGEDGAPTMSFAQLEAGAQIHFEPAQTLFEGAAHSLASLLEADETGQGLPVFPLTGKLAISQRSRHEYIESPNVVGILPGSDPLLGSEYLVYVAHLDHIGELLGDHHEDAINNGALDNASGISVMLETARLFSGSEPPRRSILFIAVTAEEKGLVGSEYYATHPTVPADSMVAAINLDMPVLLYDFADVIAFGAEHSTLQEPVRRAAGEFDTELTPDPFPEQNIFVRSDHYRFVQQGIPSIFLVTGVRDRNADIDAQPLYEAFLKDHYHRPSDDLGLAINYAAAARFTRINARIGEILANDPQRPEWNEGDFFGETFGR
jgi:Zn-dependent M28 family amino/carboxypeptidase